DPTADEIIMSFTQHNDEWRSLKLIQTTLQITTHKLPGGSIPSHESPAALAEACITPNHQQWLFESCNVQCLNRISPLFLRGSMKASSVWSILFALTLSRPPVLKPDPSAAICLARSLKNAPLPPLKKLEALIWLVKKAQESQPEQLLPPNATLQAFYAMTDLAMDPTTKMDLMQLVMQSTGADEADHSATEDTATEEEDIDVFLDTGTGEDGETRPKRTLKDKEEVLQILRRHRITIAKKGLMNEPLSETTLQKYAGTICNIPWDIFPHDPHQTLEYINNHMLRAFRDSSNRRPDPNLVRTKVLHVYTFISVWLPNLTPPHPKAHWKKKSRKNQRKKKENQTQRNQRQEKKKRRRRKEGCNG
ncbi:hypothetical protein HDV00_001616, partial [Rhizophlyctis rosea]